MKRLYQLSFITFLLFVTSCNRVGKSQAENFSIMDLAEDVDSFISDSKQVLEKFDIHEVRIYYGIDISHYQGDVLEEMNSNDSLHYVITKASEGDHYVDPDFNKNWKEIKDRGLIRGAYHFYRFGDNPVTQAEHFYSQIKDLSNNDISPIVDVESGSIHSTIAKPKMHEDLMKFIKHLESLSGRKPIIYTNTSFADEYLLDKRFSEYELWLAEYTKENPKIPDTWQDSGYLIWQKSDNYHDESIITDFDIFEGKLIELIKK